VQWNLLNSAVINLADTVYVGLAHTSHLDSTLNDAEFDNIVINSIPLSTSLVENMGYSPLRLYPNPGNTMLHIALQENDGLLQVAFYNIEGRLIQERSTRLKNKQASLDIRGLNPGTYFIKIRGRGTYASTWICK
jgi:hypothetical protein